MRWAPQAAEAAPPASTAPRWSHAGHVGSSMAGRRDGAKSRACRPLRYCTHRDKFSLIRPPNHLAVCGGLEKSWQICGEGTEMLLNITSLVVPDGDNGLSSTGPRRHRESSNGAVRRGCPWCRILHDGKSLRKTRLRIPWPRFFPWLSGIVRFRPSLPPPARQHIAHWRTVFGGIVARPRRWSPCRRILGNGKSLKIARTWRFPTSR